MASTNFESEFFIYGLANTFSNNLGLKICDETDKYLGGKVSKKYGKLDQEDKIYYSSYALEVARSLMDYIPKASLFSLNSGSDDDDNDRIYNFKIKSSKCGTKYIRIINTDDFTEDIIPRKLMKICKYRKNTKVNNAYTEEYDRLCKKIYKKTSSKEKYSKLTQEKKNDVILQPITSLVSNTLSMKRKCAPHLYSHLFKEANSDTIVLKIYKKRFVMYDFGTELKDPEIKSFKLVKKDPDEIILKFNNGSKFHLVLKTNSTEIKEVIALKFHVKFLNMDELFMVRHGSI